MTLQQADIEMLLQANRMISSKLHVDDVLESVMASATKVVKAEASSLLLLDAKKNELYFDVALGKAKESVKQIRLKIGEGIAGWVAEKRAPLIVNDVTRDPRFTVKVDKSTKFQTKSILAVPLMAKGKLIGVIEAINKEKNGHFSEQDREVFEAFGSQSAVAIENAQLFSETEQEKEKLSTIFTQMSDGVLFLDGDQNIVLLNNTAELLLGLNSKEVEGRRFDSKLLEAFQFPVGLQDISQIKEELSEYEMVRTKGKDLYLSLTLRKLPAAKHVPQGGALILLRDETEEKRGESLKRNFLSLISHKLKTPLTVILGYGPTLMQSGQGLSSFQTKALDAIHKQGLLLGNLVDKLLRFTLIESDNLTQKKEKTSLPSLIGTASKDLLEDYEGVSIKIDQSVEKTPAVMADPNLMLEVLKNLIENGIKFNDKKEKIVEISSEFESEKIILQIRDNGVGIPSEEMENIFLKFYQIENSFTGQVPGAGLGLSLCRKVLNEMGGQIKIDSHLGRGTNVILTLPKT